jgi:hypothetical protein
MVLNAGMLNELPSPTRSGMTPWYRLSGFVGEKGGLPFSLHVIGVSTIGQSGPQPCSNAASYVNGF